jgi:hypothetical protein
MYIVIRSEKSGLTPSSSPAVFNTDEEARVEAVRRTLENGGKHVVFKSLTAFHPAPIERDPDEDLKQNSSC